MPRGVDSMPFSFWRPLRLFAAMNEQRPRQELPRPRRYVCQRRWSLLEIT